MTDTQLPSLDHDPALTDGAEVARALGVDPGRGLTAEEAAARLTRFGPNELRERAGTPLWRRVLDQFKDPLILLLLAAVAISVIAWVAEGAHGAPVDAIVIAVVVVGNALVGLVQEARAARAVAALSVMTQAQARVLRDGELRSVPNTELVPGDIVQLAEGDQIGADARLLSADALRVAEASLTGESTPVEKSAATLERPVPLGDRSDMVYKGTSVSRGSGQAVVTATGMNTEMGAIAAMLDATEEERTPLQREVGRLGRMIGRIVIAIALVVMITIAIAQRPSTIGDWVSILLLGVSLAVAAVPEGLPAILSVVLALGVQRMAKRNAIVKKLSSVETLGGASVICTDKTGTLTQNEMTIQRVVTASGEVELTGVGYAPDGEALVAGAPLEDGDLKLEAQFVLSAGALANDAQLSERDGGWTIEGDPTDGAFLVAERKLAGTHEQVRRYARLGTIPFSSERKMMSTAHRREEGEVVLLAKGAPDVLLDRCTRIQVGDRDLPLTEEQRARVLAGVERLSAQALRTLGVAFRRAPELDHAEHELHESAERDLIFGGVVGIIDPPRPEAARAIEQAHRAGIRVIMITGDHPATATRIGTDLGILSPGESAVPGAELEGLSEREMRDVVRRVSAFARVAPEHKLRIVDALQAEGLTVAMTGDGVNDAPALKSADIGIAMGVTGTEVTKEAAKLVLADDNFATIVAAVREGRAIFDNIRKLLRYLLFSNTGEVLTVFLGVLLAGVLGISGASDEGVIAPLLATQILWINLVTDAAPALAMGVDPEIDDVMARPPRSRSEPVINGIMWVGIATTGVTMAVVALLTIDIFLPGGLIPGGTDSFETARTAGFMTLVLAVLLTAFNARSATSSAFRGIFTNRWLWAAVGLAAALQVAVVYVPFLQIAFGTEPLDGVHWIVCIAMASAVLWVEELRKAIMRRTASRSASRQRG